jgi:hypothetical protein
VVIYGNKEFIFTSAEKWEEFGNEGNYKVVQEAVADQNLSGASVIKGVSQDANGKITVSTRDLTCEDIGAQPAGSYQPAGDYKIKQVVKSGQLTGAQVVDSWSQNENGELAITTRELTPKDIGAVKSISADIGLTAERAEDNVTIGIDDTVVFVLNCNW